MNAPLGLAMTLTSSFAFSAMALLVALLGPRFSSGEMASVRFWVQGVMTLIAITVLRWRRLRQPSTWCGKRANRSKLLIRGAVGATAMLCYFFSLAAAPSHVAEVSLIIFLNVPLTAVFAALLPQLKERFTLVDAVVTVVCLAGVVLVAQPAPLFGSADTSDPLSPLVIIVSLFGAVCSALAYVTIRMIGPGEDALVITLIFSLVGAVLAPASSAAMQQAWLLPVSPREWAMIMAIGGTAFFGQVLLNRGIQIAPAGPAAVMRYGDVFFGIAFQATVFARPLSALQWVGAVMVLSGVVSVVYKQHRKAREAAGAARLAHAAALVEAGVLPPSQVVAAVESDTAVMLPAAAVKAPQPATAPAQAATGAAQAEGTFAIELAQLRGGADR